MRELPQAVCYTVPKLVRLCNSSPQLYRPHKLSLGTLSNDDKGLSRKILIQSFDVTASAEAI